MQRPTDTLRLLAGFAALLAMTGCAGYRLGSMLPDDIKSVAVPTFVNQAKEPLLEAETTSATIEEFQKDGSLVIESETEADTILNVTLTEYRLDPVSYQKDDRNTAKEYRMTLHASFELVRRDTGAVVARNPRVRGETVFQFTGDLSSSKLVALPDAATDLAHSIVEKVVEAW